MTYDSYFSILVKVFTNHILAEKTHIFHESCKMRRTQDYGLPQIVTTLLGNVKTLKHFHRRIQASSISSSSRSFVNIIFQGAENNKLKRRDN